MFSQFLIWELAIKARGRPHKPNKSSKLFKKKFLKQIVGPSNPEVSRHAIWILQNRFWRLKRPKKSVMILSLVPTRSKIAENRVRMIYSCGYSKIETSAEKSCFLRNVRTNYGNHMETFKRCKIVVDWTLRCCKNRCGSHKLRLKFVNLLVILQNKNLGTFWSSVVKAWARQGSENYKTLGFWKA